MVRGGGALKEGCYGGRSSYWGRGSSCFLVCHQSSHMSHIKLVINTLSISCLVAIQLAFGTKNLGFVEGLLALIYLNSFLKKKRK